MQAKELFELEDCECCGAAIGKCSDWVWHYEHEDCRAIREPMRATASSEESVIRGDD